MRTTSLKHLLAVTAVAGLCCTGATAGTYKSITIDGSFEDWTGVPLAHSDPTNSVSTNVVDYADIYVANDDDYLYIRFTLHKAANPFTFLQNLFIDSDYNTASGFSAGGYVGSEMLIQEGTGYQEKNGGFNEGGIQGLDWLAAPTGAGTEFEARISRAATYASDSLPVFAYDWIALVLEAEVSFTPTEWAPALLGGITYLFEPAPTPLDTNLELINLTAAWQANDAGADLGVLWLDPYYYDSGAGWMSGPGLLGYTPNPEAYPPIYAPLSPGPNTYYFRTHFNWSYLSDNVAFVATNYLSDGAVLYLNGTEVRRVRMPAGTINFNTSATGSASPVGQVDVFGISGGALIIGDNILAVETHQEPGTGADMVFGLSLTAAADFAVLNVNTNLPANQAVVAGDSVTLTSDIIGSGPLSHQWFKNGTPLPGANQAKLTFPVVLTTDAGNYALVTSNASSTVTTRAAVLSVGSTPVTFNDDLQPADAYTLEGQPVTLNVYVSGSPILQYQWFKDNSPILDATNVAYTIENPTLSDSGGYKAIITNPSGSTNSRTAAVTVLPDEVPPSITAVLASFDQIAVNFSSPVDSVTANTAGNYKLNGGLTILSAVIDPLDASKVNLTTSGAMTLGTPYQLTVSGVTDLYGNKANTTIAFASRIAIDGNFNDWQGITPVYSGPIGIAGAADFKDIYLYSDVSHYYCRVTLWQDIPSGSGQFPAYVNMFFNTDNDDLTGYSAIGSELLIQSGFSYQQKNGGFNEGAINALNWMCLPSAPATNFEFSVSRAATFASDGTPVFPTNGLHFVFEGMTPAFSVQNRAPASGVLSFTNNVQAPVPPLPLGPLVISSLSGALVSLAWDAPGNLQSLESLTSGSWTNVPGATSPVVIPVSGTQSFFRVSN